MNPRIRHYRAELQGFQWICYGDKGNSFHCAFGSTREAAYRKWAETEPVPAGHADHVGF